MLRRLPILPAIAQWVGPVSMNDVNARDRNPLREESSLATEEGIRWLLENRIFDYQRMETVAIRERNPWLFGKWRSLAIAE